MKLPAALKYSHLLLRQVIRPGDNVIDATMGNGNDTAFLAKLVGTNGNVYSFDIQKQALTNTKSRLKNANLTRPVTLYQIGHQHILDTIGMTNIKGVIFNLGYLPGGDKIIVTLARSTIRALKQCLMLLQLGGVIILVLYYGPLNDPKEKAAVIHFASQLNQKKYSVLQYQFINQIHEPPILIAIQRIN